MSVHVSPGFLCRTLRCSLIFESGWFQDAAVSNFFFKGAKMRWDGEKNTYNIGCNLKILCLRKLVITAASMRRRSNIENNTLLHSHTTLRQRQRV